MTKQTTGPWRAGRRDMLSEVLDEEGMFKNIYGNEPHKTHHVTGNDIPVTVARVYGKDTPENIWGNVDLILSACNACFSINEKNPQVVAAEIPAIVAELKSLYRAYVNVLEIGRDHIVSAGGDCDPVDVMEKGDPALCSVRALLSRISAKEQDTNG